MSLEAASVSSSPASAPALHLALGVLVGAFGALAGVELRERFGRGAAERDLHRIGQVHDLVGRTYVHDLEPMVLRDGALTGMLENLDAYSRFYDGDEAASLESETAGTYRGVGVGFVPGDEPWQVLFTLHGSPAERAGIVLGDRVVAVDGRPIAELDAGEVRARLANEVGAVVELELAGRDGGRRTVHLTPEPVLDPSVAHVRWLDRGAGLAYVALAGFSKRTPEEFDRTIDALRGAGLRQLVLDLRGNLGGVLDAATHVADRVLEQGVIVRSQTRRGESSVEAGSVEPWLSGVPLVVLVDRETASSSEVLAGALQDHRVAVVVGERTYGKGTVQTLTRLPNGEGIVKLTTALYLTPAGRRIERSLDGAWNSGLEPDVLVEPQDTEREALRAFLAGTTPPLDQQPAIEAWERELGRELFARPPEDAALTAALDLLRGDRPGPVPLVQGVRR